MLPGHAPKPNEEIKLLSLKMSSLSKERINKYRENIVDVGFIERCKHIFN